jgi:hypothetical protein
MAGSIYRSNTRLHAKQLCCFVVHNTIVETAMNFYRIPLALPLLSMALLASSAHGQERLLAPLNAATPVPLSVYHSDFAGYRSNLDPQPVAWRTVNDLVSHTGGHAGHTMGQAKPVAPAVAAPPAPVPAKPKPAAAPDPAHQHHHKE